MYIRVDKNIGLLEDSTIIAYSQLSTAPKKLEE